jgi:hypothetical protein
MATKPTIAIEDEVPQVLPAAVGGLREIIEGYRAMAADEEYEREAQEWIENLAGDVADERG